MAALQMADPDIKRIKLEGTPLEHAKRFNALITEGYAELRAIREEMQRQMRAANDRMQVVLSAEWRNIVSPYGYDPISTWEGQHVMLDLDYIADGVAFLREHTEGGVVSKVAEANGAAPGSKLN